MPSPTSPADRPWRASLARSVRLFRDFRHEQDDPARFYTALAADSAAPRAVSTPTWPGATLLDVGGGPGYFRDAFSAAGATYFVARRRRRRALGPSATSCPARSSAAGWPCRSADDAVDVCYSSNVLEHVPDPWLMADEMVRVTRPGGITFISYTVWFGPWGGHETAPWHYLGGMRARRRYARKHGKEPKNRYGESLFPVTVAAGLALGRSAAGRRRARPGARATTRAGAALLMLRAGGAGGGDVESRHRAAQAVTLQPTPARPSAGCSGCVSVACCRCSSASRSCSRPAAGPRHQARPGRRPGSTSSVARCTCGTPRVPSASCRTRPTATCGRWVRSSLLGVAARRCRLGRAAAVAGPGPVRGLRRDVRLAGARARRPVATSRCLVAGLAFALSPRMLTVWAPISIEALAECRSPRGCCCRWSSARARVARRAEQPPVGARRGDGRRRQRGGDLRRAAARRAVAPDPSPRARGAGALMMWWPAVPCSARSGGWCRCSCWARYSPPFLDYIESAAQHDVPDHAVRRAARHLELGALRRRAVAGRQRPARATTT